MSKKKKGKKSKKSYYHEYQFGGKKDSKKSGKKKGSKKSYYAEPKLKSVKPTLSKKDAKKNRKMLLAPVEIPEAFIKSRKSCNHVGDVLTVAEFKGMTPTYAAFTPMLDTMVGVFGEENVAVCAQCYDVLVNASAIDEAAFDKAIATLYAAANMAVSYNRMKPDEIKEIAKIRMNLTGWGKIKERFLAAKATITVADTEGGSGQLSEEDLSQLNRSGGAYVT
ncbi:hypothetical protein [uncultured Duncaniella sp.]|uniref:hypothetical protein n=1 Tax=uncultured Duncaniella sp. TaxID=2768039 RepID=UPI00262F1527|nr:hypothetical protein [uncultured Duncaniella sp.]